MEKPVRLGKRILVQWVIPCRLTFAALAAGAPRWGKREIISNGGHCTSSKVLGGHDLLGSKFPVQPNYIHRVRRVEGAQIDHHFQHTFVTVLGK